MSKKAAELADNALAAARGLHDELAARGRALAAA